MPKRGSHRLGTRIAIVDHVIIVLSGLMIAVVMASLWFDVPEFILAALLLGLVVAIPTLLLRRRWSREAGPSHKRRRGTVVRLLATGGFIAVVLVLSGAIALFSICMDSISFH